jgi:hypothetical protein
VSPCGVLRELCSHLEYKKSTGALNTNMKALSRLCLEFKANCCLRTFCNTSCALANMKNYWNTEVEVEREIEREREREKMNMEVNINNIKYGS